MRAANLPGLDENGFRLRGFLFAVNYMLCHKCQNGWVEQPYPVGPNRRRGLAADLLALHAENPGYRWHTLGGHIDGSPAFWDAIGAGVHGGYRHHGVCEHATAGG